MIKKNDKGFAVSALLYGLLILVFLIIGLLMSLMSITRKNTNNLVYDIEQELNRFSETSTVFVYDKNLNDREYIVPHGQEGWYRIELWGAGSGNDSSVYGRGSYTSGVIYLQENDFLYFHIGEKGSERCTRQPYNGGARARYCGGGATDVRLTAGGWQDETSKKNRIMVAAGAGGHGDGGSIIAPGAGGGTQEPGTPGLGTVMGNYGGGSGYYGGSGTFGGSSYISGYAGVNAVDTNGTPTRQALHFSGRKFYDGVMIPGVNSGHGKAKIEKISSNPSTIVPTQKDSNIVNLMSRVRYINEIIEIPYSLTKSPWKEIQVIKDGVNLVKNPSVKVYAYRFESGLPINCGELPAAVKDGAILEFNEGIINSLKGYSQLLIQVDLQAEYNVDEIAIFHSQEYINSSPRHSKIEVGGTNQIMHMIENSYHPETFNGVRISKSDISLTDKIPEGTYYLYTNEDDRRVLNCEEEKKITFDFLEGNKTSQWTITPITAGSNLHKIVNNETKNVLQHIGDNYQTPPSGSYLEAINYHENFPWQNWIFEPQGNGTYKIKPQNLLDYCIESKNNKAVINKCDPNSRAQQFNLIQTAGDNAV